MLQRLYFAFRPVRFYALFLLLPLGWFTWGAVTGTRLLGDDNESTETLSQGARGRSSGSHARFYHK